MRKSNHLSGENSPYLLQHMHNPVNWYPWGDEALKKAKEENKPLLISIGYAACHWCHVMERESFEDEQVAALMNEHFVCVKVDREERPDIDHLYMNAVQLVTGQGGWPLHCFALPDGKPFWGGTYFPKSQWTEVLGQLARLYSEQYDDVVKQANDLTKGVSDSHFVAVGEGQALFGKEDARRMYHNLMEYMDAEEGGMRGAPKFPLPGNLEFLLHYYSQTGEEPALEQLNLSLRKMAMGGIYDQLGGGFARYATDAAWKIPHFEKMLYDNAQLISVYSKAWKVTKDSLYQEVVYDTIAFAERELLSPEGLFYCSLDADSEGEEGKYYVWTEKEMDACLGADAALVKKYYQVGEEGFWEKGKNILLRRETPVTFCAKAGMDEKTFSDLLIRARQKLMNHRNSRVSPGLDDKLITSWNALMIEGLAEAYMAFGEERFLVRAETAARFLCAQAMESDGKLYRSLKNGKPQIGGFLEDYALLIKAFIRLYEASLNLRYLLSAKKLLLYVMKHFSAGGSSMFLFAAGNEEQLASGHFELFDNVMPASNSVMAGVLFAMAHYFDMPEWGQRSSEMLRDIKGKLDRYSSSFTGWGQLLLQHVYPFYTVVITGPETPGEAAALHMIYRPDKIVAGLTHSSETGLPLFAGRYKPGRTLLFVCRQGRCQLPVTSVPEALKQMA